MRSLRISALIFSVTVSALFAQAPPLPKGVERVTSVEGITEYRLANGLQVLLFPDNSKPTVTFWAPNKNSASIVKLETFD